MFGELMKLSWMLEQLNLVTPNGSEHKPIGWTALHLLADRRSPSEDLCKKRAELAPLLLDKGANPFSAYSQRDYAIAHGSRRGLVEASWRGGECQEQGQQAPLGLLFQLYNTPGCRRTRILLNHGCCQEARKGL